MVDRLRDEAGTTLAELLVVVVILGVIGTVTTVGIVAGFRAQLDSTNVAETLDGMRIATQRVRDFVRGANEVCATSTDKQLRLWTDGDRDGNVQTTEIDIFELHTLDDGVTKVFQRRTPTGTGDDVVQLIRDDIIDGTVFKYDQDPANQPRDLRCLEGTSPGTGTAAVRLIDVLFSVEHPQDGELPLNTTTSVRLRNADLAEPSRNKRPKAVMSISCPNADRTCTFDGSASSDPEDGTVSFYSWEIKDGATIVHTEAGPGPGFGVFDYTFAPGTGNRDYQVLLTVNDTDGAPDSTDGVAHPVESGTNPPPVAEFTVSCSGRSCAFDATASKDFTKDGAPGTIQSYQWDYGDAGAGTGDTTGSTPSYTFAADKTYTVTLTVTDSEDPAASSSLSRTFAVGSNVIHVTNMSGVQSGSGNDRTATISTQLSLTTGGHPGQGLVITIIATDKGGTTLRQSCDTTTSGNCSVSFTGLNNARFPITASVESVEKTGIYVHEPDRDTPKEVTVS